jgi:acyl-CoA thioesterase FadM
MGRTALFARAWTMTGRMEVRYRYPAPLGEKLTVSAWITRERSRAFESKGEVRLPGGDIVAESTGLFLVVPPDVRRQAEDAHPEFAPFFANLPPEHG